jgi:hypothetical protein
VIFFHKYCKQLGVQVKKAIALYEDLSQCSFLAWNAEKRSEG